MNAGGWTSSFLEAFLVFLTARMPVSVKAPESENNADKILSKIFPQSFFFSEKRKRSALSIYAHKLSRTKIKQPQGSNLVDLTTFNNDYLSEASKLLNIN